MSCCPLYTRGLAASDEIFCWTVCKASMRATRWLVSTTLLMGQPHALAFEVRDRERLEKRPDASSRGVTHEHLDRIDAGQQRESRLILDRASCDAARRGGIQCELELVLRVLNRQRGDRANSHLAQSRRQPARPVVLCLTARRHLE